MIHSIPYMLPDGFQWNCDRTRLDLRGYGLIQIDPHSMPVPLLNVMRECLPHRLFFTTHETAIRYAEVWCGKWEADIRLFVGNKLGAAELAWRQVAEGPKNASPPTWTSTDETRRRRGGTRKVGTESSANIARAEWPTQSL